MDLELDLAAQQLRLQHLQEEIETLKTLRSQLQGAKNSPEPPSWATDRSTVPAVLSLVSVMAFPVLELCLFASLLLFHVSFVFPGDERDAREDPRRPSDAEDDEEDLQRNPQAQTL